MGVTRNTLYHYVVYDIKFFPYTSYGPHKHEWESCAIPIVMEWVNLLKLLNYLVFESFFSMCWAYSKVREAILSWLPVINRSFRTCCNCVKSFLCRQTPMIACLDHVLWLLRRGGKIQPVVNRKLYFSLMNWKGKLLPFVRLFFFFVILIPRIWRICWDLKQDKFCDDVTHCGWSWGLRICCCLRGICKITNNK